MIMKYERILHIYIRKNLYLCTLEQIGFSVCSQKRPWVKKTANN